MVSYVTFVLSLYGPWQANSAFEDAKKCADSYNPAHARSQPGLCSPWIHSMEFIGSGSGQRRP